MSEKAENPKNDNTAEFFDGDDHWLSEAVDKYEDASTNGLEKHLSSAPPKCTLGAADGTRGSPLEQFRPGYLWVSDLTRQHWCEQHLYYTFTIPTIVEENPVITEGSNLHLARELAVHDVVNVKVTSNEDIWAVKVINLLSSIQSLLHGSPIAREVPIFGAPFDEDVFVVGLIDELKFDFESFQLELWELKTRKHRSLPSKSQQSQHRLQVMLYKKLFDDLVKGKLNKETVVKHLKLDLDKTFGDDIHEMLNLKCHSCKNLKDLLEILFERIQCLTCASQIGVEYVHQGTNETVGTPTVDYKEEELKATFQDYLKFWRGSRAPMGVDIEEAWKCQSCDFADICDWRKKKAEQYSKGKSHVK